MGRCRIVAVVGMAMMRVVAVSMGVSHGSMLYYNIA